MYSPHTQTDVISVNIPQLSAFVGSDGWNRLKPQLVDVSVNLYLENSFLDAAGQSDDLSKSINYVQLTESITKHVAGSSFDGVEKLIAFIAEEVFSLAGKPATEVQVLVKLPDQILLAQELSVDIKIARDSTMSQNSRKISITDLILPVLIGVHPHEREAKQRVVTNIVFNEHPGDRPLLDYRTIVSDIIKKIEPSSYLTLEKFVLEIVRDACLVSEHIDSVTVRSQKPSALRVVGVEITRRRAEFL